MIVLLFEYAELNCCEGFYYICVGPMPCCKFQIVSCHVEMADVMICGICIIQMSLCCVASRNTWEVTR